MTSAGVKALGPLTKLEALNLTDTAVDDAASATLDALPALKRVWYFGSRISPDWH